MPVLASTGGLWHLTVVNRGELIGGGGLGIAT